MAQKAAFATGVLPNICAFHRYTWNSAFPYQTQACRYRDRAGVEPPDLSPDLAGRLRALYAQGIRITLAPYVLPRLLARS